MGGAVKGPLLSVHNDVSQKRDYSGLGGGLCLGARKKPELGSGETWAGHTLTLIPGKVTAEEA